MDVVGAQGVPHLIATPFSTDRVRDRGKIFFSVRPLNLMIFVAGVFFWDRQLTKNDTGDLLLIMKAKP